MANNPEVVIIGGGAAGCATAYNLSLAGIRCTVIEREGVGTQASGYAAGGLNPLEGTNIPGPLGHLAMESYLLHSDLWEPLKESTGIDYEWRRIELIKVCFDHSERPDLRETHQRFNELANKDFSADWLTAQELQELEPRIAPESSSGLLVNGNASVNSYQYTLALAKAAENMGVSFISGSVTGIQLQNDRVTAVKLDSATIPCETLVIATGPWSQDAENWLGTQIPVSPLKGEILRLELPGTALQYDFSGGGGSIYSKPDGQIWCGSTEEWKGFSKDLTESAKLSIMKGATTLIPRLADATLVLHTACLRPVTPDWLPIIGPAPSWSNVFLATGAGKKGILLSPAIGKSISDLITEGKTSLSIDSCLPDRVFAAK